MRIASLSLLKTFDPPVSAVHGKTVRALRRQGKRIVFDLNDDLHLIIHLMIAGRFQWKPHGASIPHKLGHAAFDFPTGEENVVAQHRGGVEPLEISLDEFTAALTRENRTLEELEAD
ncbi:MAG: DNA-formamidopyrimidine glycosylase family protein [Gemmatimonadota bacterium]